MQLTARWRDHPPHPQHLHDCLSFSLSSRTWPCAPVVKLGGVAKSWWRMSRTLTWGRRNVTHRWKVEGRKASFLRRKQAVLATDVHTQSLSHVWLCDFMNCSLPGSFVHGILQTRILEWVAISSSRGSSRPGDRTCVSYVSCIAGRLFTCCWEWANYLLELHLWHRQANLINLSQLRRAPLGQRENQLPLTYCSTFVLESGVLLPSSHPWHAEPGQKWRSKAPWQIPRPSQGHPLTSPVTTWWPSVCISEDMTGPRVLWPPAWFHRVFPLMLQAGVWNLTK